MPKGYYTSDELLQSIRIRIAMPQSQITFSDTDLLQFAQEETDLKLVPSILSVKEEFYVTAVEYPLLPMTSGYDIPYRAIGQKIRAVFYKQTSGSLIPLAQIPIERLPDYQTSSFPYTFAAVYLQDSQVMIAPDVLGAPTGSLVVRYYLKPNNLVAVNEGALVTAIDRTTGNISVKIGGTNTAQVPNNITVNNLMDFIQTKGTHRTLSFDVTPVSVNTNGGIISFNPSDIPSGLAVGDWICNAQETVIPQVPSELHVMLAQAVACRVLESLGDSQGLQNAVAKLNEMEAKLLNVISVRIEAPGKKVNVINGLLEGGRLGRRRFY